MALPKFAKFIATSLNRFTPNSKFHGLLFRVGQLLETAELNEAFSLTERHIKNVANASLGRGSLRSGGDIQINRDEGKVSLKAATVIVDGKELAVPSAILNVPMAGKHSIGIAVTHKVVTELDDPDLRGITPDKPVYGEALAARLIYEARWALNGDPFYVIHVIQDGNIVVHQKAPYNQAANTAVEQHIYEAHGPHVIRGLDVVHDAYNQALEKQTLLISAGAYRALGVLNEKPTDTRFEYLEAPDIYRINDELHPYPAGGGEVTINLLKGPIKEIHTITIQAQVTEEVTHNTAGGADIFANFPVEEIVSVKQGGTTYNQGVDFVKTGTGQDWLDNAPQEPQPGSKTTVVYRFRKTIVATEVLRQGVKISGGVSGSNVSVSYSFKLPRLDLLVAHGDGTFELLRGLSNPFNVRYPQIPERSLAIAWIKNNWGLAPTIQHVNQTPGHEADIHAMHRTILLLTDQVTKLQQRLDIGEREKAAHRGFFVDPFLGDDQRDLGIAQTAFIRNGFIELPVAYQKIDVSLGDDVIMLPGNEVVIVEQPFRTSQVLINKFASFGAMPGRVTINPSVHRWNRTSRNEVFAQQGVLDNLNNGQVSIDRQTISRVTVDAQFLDPIDVNFSLSLFGPGEILDRIEFDGIELALPANKTANANGELAGTFTIPENIPTGRKAVRFVGRATEAETTFIGEGTITNETILVTRRAINPVAFDPVAQSFLLNEDRVVTGVSLEFTAKDNDRKPVIVNLRDAQTGNPEGAIHAEGVITDFTVSDPAAVKESNWTKITFSKPAAIFADRYYAFVCITDSDKHSIAYSQLGSQSNPDDNNDDEKPAGFDTRLQKWVTRNPVNGDMYVSSNGVGFKIEPDSDVTHRIHAMDFTANERLVEVGTYNVNQLSDIAVMTTFFSYGSSTSVTIEMERTVNGNPETVRFPPDQVLSFDEFINGEIKIRLVLKGTNKVSPLVEPNVTILLGTLQQQATYYSQTWEADVTKGNVNLRSWIDANTPPGSTITLSIGDQNDWTAPAPLANHELGDGWYGREILREDWAKGLVRIKLEMTGTPASRPKGRSLRATAIEKIL